MLPNVIELSALGTKWWITASPEIRQGDKENLLQTISKFEQDYSRFRSDSLIGQLNDHKTIHNAPTELQHMLQFALKTYRQTDGLFNVTVGGKLESLGYGSGGGHIDYDLPAHLHIGRTIHIDPQARIDLGGFGKAWLIQKLARLLSNWGYVNVYINGGGDILSSGEPSEIALEHPTNPELQIGTLRLVNQSLACSSTTKRIWGDSHNHIVNPTGGAPKYIASYVISPSILDADVCATLLLIANNAQRRQLYQTYRIEYLLISEDLAMLRSNGFHFSRN